MDRHIQAIALGIENLDTVGLLTIQRQSLHAAIDANAVIFVHDIVADFQGRELGDRQAAGPFETPAAAAVACKDLVVGEDGEPRVLEREALRDQADAQGGGGFAEHLGEPVALPRVVAQDHHPHVVGAELGEVCAQPLHGAVHGLGRLAAHEQAGVIAIAFARFGDTARPIRTWPLARQRGQGRAFEEQLARR